MKVLFFFRKKAFNILVFYVPADYVDLRISVILLLVTITFSVLPDLHRK